MTREHVFCSYYVRGSFTYGQVDTEDRATTVKILSVTCPECGSEPGAWCEYASGFRPGAFTRLHRTRIKAAGAWREPA